ncbi:MAG: hypothetical protein GYB18_08360 [Oceanospirillales bacterium]|nr:hypothetical protein [Oceanospirillales bacterium]
MPHQNRVTPTGDLIAVNARGTLMGNRGRLHNATGQIIKSSDRKAWIICELQFKGRQQEIMAPGSYTQLFFLDEATALAAGHRPCHTCRRTHYNQFTSIYKETFPDTTTSIGDIDEQLKQQRSTEHPQISLSDVPNGAMVSFESQVKDSWLVWDQYLYRWSPEGYTDCKQKVDTASVFLITPWNTTQVLRAGYVPTIHPSANSLITSSETGIRSVSSLSTTPNISQKPVNAAPSKQDSVATKPNERENLTSSNETLPRYKLKTTPRGKQLHTYFAAILSATGMDKGKSANLKLFFSNFQGHMDANRIQKCPGGYQLTVNGQDYFADRVKIDNHQGIDPALYQAMLEGLRNGGDEWVSLQPGK